MSITSIQHLSDKDLWGICRNQGRSLEECNLWVDFSHILFMQKCTEQRRFPAHHCAEHLHRVIAGSFVPPAAFPGRMDRFRENLAKCIEEDRKLGNAMGHCNYGDVLVQVPAALVARVKMIIDLFKKE